MSDTASAVCGSRSQQAMHARMLRRRQDSALVMRLGCVKRVFNLLEHADSMVDTKDINNPKGRWCTRRSKRKLPRDALWAFCEKTNTCGRGFSAERRPKISVTSPSGQ
jgi:hypothetical protein